MTVQDQVARERVRAIRVAVDHLDALLSREWHDHGHSQRYDDLTQRRRLLQSEVEAPAPAQLLPWCTGW